MAGSLAVRWILRLGLSIDNGFDPVAVKINNESREIVWTMLGMKARPSVIASAVGQGGTVERTRRLL